MLSEEDNRILTQVGPGTPLGELFRCFWQPVALSRDVVADGPPRRLRILGEDLVTFRDSAGRVGVVDAYCAHRRAQLFWGRNEDCGIRCVYHGWKYDVDGKCVDMPTAPPDSRFRQRMVIKAYPAADAGGFIWAYMGKDPAPELPMHEWMLLPESRREPVSWLHRSNWLQGLEGSMDPVHLSFLHQRFDSDVALDEQQREGGFSQAVARKDPMPEIDIVDTDYGFVYGARRDVDGDAGAELSYWRLTHWLMPSLTLIPSPHGVPYGVRGWIPVDDHHTITMSVACGPFEPREEDAPNVDVVRSANRMMSEVGELAPYTLPDGYVIDAYQPVRTKENDYLIDRELQRTVNFTGTTGSAPDEDRAMTEGMGSVVDRTREHLGTSDIAIIAARRKLIRAAKALAKGTLPVAAAQGALYRQRPLDVAMPTRQVRDVIAEVARRVDEYHTAPVSGGTT